MTQLMLFESTSATLATDASDFVRAGQARGVQPTSSSSPAVAARETAKRVSEPEPGMHRMGDLARLVLMRYELVAKRRAALASRHAS